ncbi:S8 family serine peptidase [Longimicrobium sp.]|uniref:S8 family serine peptidase n=1 Tax=Longimicrobium sp. TaxID=2029185 RepID=UPI003B3AA22F
MNLPRTNRLLALAGALALGTSACADRGAPLEPAEAGAAALNAAPSDTEPFYYYQGERVLLDAEPSELVVVSRQPDGAAAVRQVLAELGITPGGDRELPQAAGHRVITLPASTTRARALEARERLRKDPRFEFASVGYRTRAGGGKVLLLNRVAVRFREGTSRGEIASIAARVGARVAREPNPSRGALSHWLEYGPGTDPLRVAAALDRHPQVEWADPDKVSDLERHYIPTDPFFAQQYYLRNNTRLNGVRVDINAADAWDLTTGAWAPSTGGFNIAVVDDGVDASHPDFAGHVQWGFDAFGINDGFASNPECTGDSHGTMSAGTILQQHNSAAGGGGAAPGVNIIPIRIFRCGTVASNAQIADALNFAWYWLGVQVLSNSWGGAVASNAITSAVNAGSTQGRGGRGAVFVFSAGNTSARGQGIIGPVRYPASLAASVAVGAINRDGQVTDYSPDGSELDLVAPSGHFTGVCIGDVVTADLVGARGCNDGPGGDMDYTSTFSGTSAAAPQVAGVFSMLLAREPTLTAAQAKTRVYDAADWWGAANRFGRGKVNAYRALVGRLGAWISGPTFIETPGYYTWTATSTGGVQAVQYTWQTSQNGVNWSTGPTGDTFNAYVYPGENFYVRIVATQGPDDARAETMIYVQAPCYDPNFACAV